MSGRIWRVTVLDYRWFKNWIVISSFYVVLVSFACGHDSLSAIYYGSMYDSPPYISEFWKDFLFQLMKNSGSTPSMFLKSPHVGTNEVIEEAPEIPGSRGVWVMFLLTVLIQEWLGEHFSQRKTLQLGLNNLPSIWKKGMDGIQKKFTTFKWFWALFFFPPKSRELPFLPCFQ